jgi:hypothetical protein
VTMKKLTIITLFFILCGCGKEPVDNEKFISDSEIAFNILITAFSENRNLTSHEQSELITYDVYYGEETDYLLSTDQSLVSVLIRTMESSLSLSLNQHNQTKIGESIDFGDSFTKDAEEVRKEIDNLKTIN